MLKQLKGLSGLCSVTASTPPEKPSSPLWDTQIHMRITSIACMLSNCLVFARESFLDVFLQPLKVLNVLHTLSGTFVVVIDRRYPTQCLTSNAFPFFPRYTIRKAAASVCRLELIFQKFDIESSTDCEYDYLQVGSEKLCGVFTQNTSGIYEFDEPEKALKFHSDAANSRPGFQIKMRQIDCGKQEEEEDGGSGGFGMPEINILLIPTYDTLSFHFHFLSAYLKLLVGRPLSFGVGIQSDL